jgi:hypothetical protein
MGPNNNNNTCLIMRAKHMMDALFALKPGQGTHNSNLIRKQHMKLP